MLLTRQLRETVLYSLAVHVHVKVGSSDSRLQQLYLCVCNDVVHSHWSSKGVSGDNRRKQQQWEKVTQSVSSFRTVNVEKMTGIATKPMYICGQCRTKILSA